VPTIEKETDGEWDSRMNTNDLIEALDQRYGNPHAKDSVLIQEAIRLLRLQADEIRALHAQLRESNND
jgi:hypothetical protein